MMSGIYTMSAEHYHADPCDVPSLSCSIAKILLNQTPAHAWLAHPRLNPNQPAEQEASRLDIGTAAHALLLEGVDSIAVCDFDDWRKKEAQAMRDDARAAGKIPLLSRQYEDINAMVSIAKDAALKAGFNLSAGKPEQTVIWQEGDTHCRARVDWLSADRDLIIDYKTTALPNPAAWMRAIGSNGYDVQASFYQRGVQKLNRNAMEPEFVFMVQETEAPYCCYFVELSATLQEIGRVKVEKALAIWSACMKSNNWPGYPSGTMEAEAMPWQINEAEEINCELQGFSVEGFLFGSVDRGGKVGTLGDFDK